jgi:hypothetical protein
MRLVFFTQKIARPGSKHLHKQAIRERFQPSKVQKAGEKTKAGRFTLQ